MTVAPDPLRLLFRALRCSAAAAGHTVTVAHDKETPWSSATFVGVQYQVTVTGNALDAWLATLPDADLPIRGHFVASLEVACSPTGAALTVLMLKA